MNRMITIFLILFSLIGCNKSKELEYNLKDNFKQNIIYKITLEDKDSPIKELSIMNFEWSIDVSTQVKKTVNNIYSLESQYDKIKSNVGNESVELQGTSENLTTDENRNYMKLTQKKFFYNLDKLGQITNFDSSEFKSDTQLSNIELFSSEESFLNYMHFIKYKNMKLQKDYTWKDVKEINKMKIELTYKISKISEDEVVIEENGKTDKVEVLGKFSIDKSTGLIKKGEESIVEVFTIEGRKATSSTNILIRSI